MKLYSASVLAGLAMLVLSGCGGVEGQFISGCKAGGADSKLCKCVYKRMKGKFGDEGIDRNLNGYPSDLFREQMVDDTVQCIKEQ